MKYVSNFIGIIIGLGILILLGYGLYWGFQVIEKITSTLDSQVIGALALIIALAILVLFVVAWSRGGRLRANQREQLRMQRAEIYSLLIDVLKNDEDRGFWHLNSEDDRHELMSPYQELDEDVADLKSLERQLALWGSRKVIYSYTKYREFVNSSGEINRDIRNYLAELVQEMRKDIGIYDLNIGDSNLLPYLFEKPSVSLSDRSAQVSS